ncbi:hypothetical protein, partial [Aliivibrio kagoshimensis]|uniref:arsenate reductase/protein-tyrosine-phosphatase family protein n=1 Tax=Aliivibrio kagoshimensis TaxID=2910230 RepID=UPI003D1519A3
YLTKLDANENTFDDDSILSFGFHKKEHRLSPRNAQVAANQFDISLQEHRSKSLYQTDIKDSDILVYFDESHKIKLESYYCCYQLFSAADLLDNEYKHDYEINDPYNGTNEKVSQCYKKIVNAVDGLYRLKQESL